MPKSWIEQLKWWIESSKKHIEKPSEVDRHCLLFWCNKIPDVAIVIVLSDYFSQELFQYI